MRNDDPIMTDILVERFQQIDVISGIVRVYLTTPFTKYFMKCIITKFVYLSGHH